MLQTTPQKGFRNLTRKPEAMTICIAARCEVESGLPKIVFCADRMISAGLQFEHGEPKIQWMTPTCLAMIASSDSLASDMIAKAVLPRFAGKSADTEAVARALGQECIVFKQRKMEQDVLVPLGLTYETVWKKSNELPAEARDEIMDELLNYEYGFRTDFLVFGIDFALNVYTPHIYVVDQDGNVRLQDYLGFGVIGSGAGMAFPEMTKYKWHRGVTISEAFVRIYNSKRAAERMGGVGVETDLFALHVFEGENKVKQVGAWPAPQELRDLLESGRKSAMEKDSELYVGILSQMTKVFVKPQTRHETQTSEVGSNVNQT